VLTIATALAGCASKSTEISPPTSHRSCTRTTLARSWRRRLKACQRVLHRSPVRRTSRRHQA